MPTISRRSSQSSIQSEQDSTTTPSTTTRFLNLDYSPRSAPISDANRSSYIPHHSKIQLETSQSSIITENEPLKNYQAPDQNTQKRTNDISSIQICQIWPLH